MIKFTKYGQPFVTLLLAGFPLDLAVCVLVGVLGLPWLGVVLAAMTVPTYSVLIGFFRDPDRRADREPIPAGELLAPADGKITDVAELVDERVGGPALRIGIFLSIFNVHLNRAPCAVRVIEITSRTGEFLNAMNPASSSRNAATDLVLEPVGGAGVNLPRRIVVRQIAGAIAQRIVTDTAAGAALAAGERFGMIRFGSRTELIVPAEPAPQVHVRVGDRVRAGEHTLLSY